LRVFNGSTVCTVDLVYRPECWSADVGYIVLDVIVDYSTTFTPRLRPFNFSVRIMTFPTVIPSIHAYFSGFPEFF